LALTLSRYQLCLTCWFGEEKKKKGKKGLVKDESFLYKNHKGKESRVEGQG